MLAFTALGFFLLLKHLDPERTISLDTDWFFRRGLADFFGRLKKPLTRLEYGFVGEIYEFVIQRPVMGVAKLVRRFDSLVVDTALVGLGRSTASFSQLLKTMASGHAQPYGLIMAAGVLALLALVTLVL